MIAAKGSVDDRRHGSIRESEVIKRSRTMEQKGCILTAKISGLIRTIIDRIQTVSILVLMEVLSQQTRQYPPAT